MSSMMVIGFASRSKTVPFSPYLGPAGRSREERGLSRTSLAAETEERRDESRRLHPPGIQQEHIFRRRQIQPQATGLQADQKQPALRVVLKRLHVGLAVRRGAVQ